MSRAFMIWVPVALWATILALYAARSRWEYAAIAGAGAGLANSILILMYIREKRRKAKS